MTAGASQSAHKEIVLQGHHLMTPAEIDTFVDVLKKDLDAVSKNANAALRKANSESPGE